MAPKVLPGASVARAFAEQLEDERAGWLADVEAAYVGSAETSLKPEQHVGSEGIANAQVAGEAYTMPRGYCMS